MRLLFVSRSLPFHHLGGMEAVAWDLARALARRNHDVEILTTRCPALDPLSVKEGVRIRTIDARSGRYSPKFWRKTVELYENDYRNRVDAVLGIGMGAHAIARRRQPGERPSVIMQSHGQPWGEFISKLSVPKPLSWIKSPKNLLEFARERTLRHYDRIVAVGPAVAHVLHSAPTSWMLGDTPVQVIANGIDQEHFHFDPTARADIRRAHGIDMNAPVLISACRLHVQKGLQESLNGFAQAFAQRPELRYIITGSGPHEADLRAQVNQQGLSKAVLFVGAIERNRLTDYLSAGDAFVFTSKRREGLALGPLEAAATGLTSILSDHLAIAGISARTVNPNSPRQIATAIEASIANRPTVRQSLLPYAYSLTKASDDYEKVLSGLPAY